MGTKPLILISFAILLIFISAAAGMINAAHPGGPFFSPWWLPLPGLVVGMMAAVAAFWWDSHEWMPFSGIAPNPPAPPTRSDNGNPDPSATREWVETKINGATSNCLRRKGSRDMELEERLSELEEARLQYGYVFRGNVWSASNGMMEAYAFSTHPDSWGDKYYSEVAVSGAVFDDGRITSGEFVHASIVEPLMDANYNTVCFHHDLFPQPFDTRLRLSAEMRKKLREYLTLTKK
jgi:hypothetical protein